MHPFRRLKVWRKSHELSLSVYRVTRGMPISEKFGLSAQMRRAAISVEANIAEGAGRSAPGDFRRFLEIASGSAAELQSHILLARDLDLMSGSSAGALLSLADEVKRMLTGLTKRVSSR
jgi:four helix bundle protein